MTNHDWENMYKSDFFLLHIYYHGNAKSIRQFSDSLSPNILVDQNDAIWSHTWSVEGWRREFEQEIQC